MAKSYDVAIVGAGPAGIFASLELCNAGLSVLLLDKGGELMFVFVPFKMEVDTVCSALHAT